MPVILQIAKTDRNLSSSIKAFKAASRENSLTCKVSFTILAPVNLVFGNLSSTNFKGLLVRQNENKLSDILSGFVHNEKKLIRNFINV
jgi:uncharacterized surface protein with fasciclin (FAS1) repeats